MENKSLDEVLTPFDDDFKEHKQIIDEFNTERNHDEHDTDTLILVTYRMGEFIDKIGIQSYYQIINEDPLFDGQHVGVLYMLCKKDDPFRSIEEFNYHLKQEPDLHQIYLSKDHKALTSTHLVHEEYCIEDRISLISILVAATIILVPLIRCEMDYDKWCEFYNRNIDSDHNKEMFEIVKNRLLGFSKFLGNDNMSEMISIYNDVEKYLKIKNRNEIA